MSYSTNIHQKTRQTVAFRHFVIVFITLSISLSTLTAQKDTKAQTDFIRDINSLSLTEGQGYTWLHSLCKDVGNRLSGSKGAEKAVSWGKSVLDTLGFDTVWLQPVMVPHWERGKKEVLQLAVSGGTKKNLDVLALGGSVGTAGKMVRGEIVEITSWDQLEALGTAGLKGKTVFYNRPMDPTRIRTFEAYGGAVDQRVNGASRAAKYGAVSVLVRSMNPSIDKWPHTGTLHYDSAFALIPAVAISTADAEELAAALHQGKSATAALQLDCRTLPDVLSYNVIGEIRGSIYPNEYLICGGHLDSWDVGEGAHDDGTGIVQSMDALNLLHKKGYRPRHSLRCVFFMNEENGLRGGVQYAAEAERKGEIHRCAIESDAGGFTPRGFTFDADKSVKSDLFSVYEPFKTYFQPYYMTLAEGGSGADIGPLKTQKGLLCGFSPDSQRYFDFHHTAADVFEAVNRRELQLGTAAIASLLYLMDGVTW